MAERAGARLRDGECDDVRTRERPRPSPCICHTIGLDGLGFPESTSLTLVPTSARRTYFGFLCHSVVGCLTLAVSGAHMWAEWLHHPYLLGGPHMETKLDLAT